MDSTVEQSTDSTSPELDLDELVCVRVAGRMLAVPRRALARALSATTSTRRERPQQAAAPVEVACAE